MIQIDLVIENNLRSSNMTLTSNINILSTDPYTPSSADIISMEQISNIIPTHIKHLEIATKDIDSTEEPFVVHLINQYNGQHLLKN